MQIDTYEAGFQSYLAIQPLFSDSIKLQIFSLLYWKSYNRNKKRKTLNKSGWLIHFLLH